GSGVEERTPRNDFLWRLHVGNDLFRGKLGARAQSRERGGSRHQLQHVAAVDAVPVFLFGVRWELVLEEVAELFRIRELVNALPVALAGTLGGLRLRNAQVN